MNRVTRLWRPAVVDRLEAPEVERLVEDLGRRQVAAELHRPGRAERARERAARLGRDADRAAAVAVAHQHRLDRVAVVGAEERLHGAVLRLLLVGDRERRERDGVAQGLAQRGRHVRHRVVARRASRRPLPHLAGAVRRLAVVGQRRSRSSMSIGGSVGATCRAPARGARGIGSGQWRVARAAPGTTSTGQRACCTT